MLVASVAQRPAQNFGRVVLDENVALEREPWRELRERFAECFFHPVVVRGALHHVAMCVSRVAVSASESASDVGIDRPESHPGCLRSVENALRRGAVVPNVLLYADNGEKARFALVCFAEQRGLRDPPSFVAFFMRPAIPEYIPKLAGASRAAIVDGRDSFFSRAALLD